MGLPWHNGIDIKNNLKFQLEDFFNKLLNYIENNDLSQAELNEILNMLLEILNLLAGRVNLTVIEYAKIPYNAAGVEFVFNMGYAEPPVIVTSLETAGDNITDAIQLCPSLIQEEIDGKMLYSKVLILPRGGAVPEFMPDGFINLHAIGKNGVIKNDLEA